MVDRALDQQSFERSERATRWVEAQPKTQPGPQEIRRGFPPDPAPFVGILLADLYSQTDGDVAQLKPSTHPSSWDIALTGDIVGGDFQLQITTGSVVEITDPIDVSATAEDVLEIMVALTGIEAGEVVVDTWPDVGRWFIHFTNKILLRLGPDLDNLPWISSISTGLTARISNTSNGVTAKGRLPGFSTSRFSFAHEDAGLSTRTVFSTLPVGIPTPQVKGAIVHTKYIPGYGQCLDAVEPRDLFFLDDSYGAS